MPGTSVCSCWLYPIWLCWLRIRSRSFQYWFSCIVIGILWYYAKGVDIYKACFLGIVNITHDSQWCLGPSYHRIRYPLSKELRKWKTEAIIWSFPIDLWYQRDISIIPRKRLQWVICLFEAAGQRNVLSLFSGRRNFIPYLTLPYLTLLAFNIIESQYAWSVSVPKYTITNNI